MKKQLIFLFLFLICFSSCKKFYESEMEPYSEKISINGTTIKYDDPSSPLYGLEIVIPDSAVFTTLDLEIQKKPIDPSLNYVFSKRDDKMYRIYQEEEYYHKMIKITLPYNPGYFTSVKSADIAIYHTDNENKVYFPLVYNIDTINHFISCITYHTGYFAVGVPILNSKGSKFTKFYPSIDGMAIVNDQAFADEDYLYNKYCSGSHGGHCAGMTNFSYYYFIYQKANGSLYNKYQYLPQQAKFVSCRVQEWCGPPRNGEWISNVPQESYRWAINRNINNLSSYNPLLIGYNTGHGLHAILAYDYNYETVFNDGLLTFYDPNDPGNPNVQWCSFFDNKVKGFSEKPMWVQICKNAQYGYRWQLKFTEGDAVNIHADYEILPDFGQEFTIYPEGFIRDFFYIVNIIRSIQLKIPAVDDMFDEFSGHGLGYTFYFKTKTVWTAINMLTSDTYEGAGDTYLELTFSSDNECSGTLTFNIPQTFLNISWLDFLVADGKIIYHVNGTRPWPGNGKSNLPNVFKSDKISGNIKAITIKI